MPYSDWMHQATKNTDINQTVEFSVCEPAAWISLLQPCISLVTEQFQTETKKHLYGQTNIRHCYDVSVILTTIT